MKVRTLLRLSLTGMFLLAGCGSTPDYTIIVDGTEDSQAPEEDEVVLTFWDSNAGPQRTPYYQELITQFEEQHPNIRVEYVGIPNKTNIQKYNAAIAANDTPDVAEIYPSWLASFTQRGALLPLDPFFEEWSEKEKISKEAIQFNREVVADQQLYAIPNTQNMDILWYRKDWYEEKGVKPPETWDEFFTSVKTLTDKKLDRYGYTIRGGKGSSFQLQRMMYAYSGIDLYFDAQGKSTINDPLHVEFLKKYMSLYKQYTPETDVTNSYKEMLAVFVTGNAALVQHNIGSYAENSQKLRPEEFAALPLPKTVQGRFVVEGGNTSGYGIFKNTEHPKEAWQLVSFLSSAQAQSYWNQQIGQLPTHSDVLKESWVREAEHIQTAFRVLEDPATRYYNPPFYLPEYRSILDNIVDPGIQSVLSQKKSIEEFLYEWANAMEKSKQKYESALKK
ncbi:sugar ABC transporter substrate-binding protein [Ammoniphilus sp. YIM 78166]|uniref:ABC transporter substrate-binding protein n=1 Tax=Ammoniphilus sp. YIM 78166 TaxID=1644106 RepID=UPI001F0FD749|nr:sugar ABC transporter substrate-binding protein [Ammoniphilus sp. YIM 78166]